MSLVLVVAMAAGVGLLGSSEKPVGTAASPTTTSTLPGYPADPASRLPVVGWLADPAPALSPPPAPVPACQASQLRAENIGGEGATGHAADFVRIENASPEPCSIDDKVVVELRHRGRLLASSSGERVPFICSGCGANRTPGPLLVPPLSARPPVQDYGEGSSEPGVPVPAFSLAQGECPGGVFPEGATLVLVVPDGRVPIANGLPLPFDYRCDYPERNPQPGRPKLLAGSAQGIPVRDFVENDKVSVEITAPRTVRAGSMLRYRIRPRVSGEVSLAALGCPGYTQRISGVAEERHRLNCEGLYYSGLLADQWFDMVLRVPRNAKPGRRTLTWELDPPFGRARASREIEVAP